MTASVIEPALRATYHLAGADATRLRRLTRQSGLDAENVLSRLAIIASISAGRDGLHADYQPSRAGRTKEIKGTHLLGRPRQAVLLLALLANAHDAEFLDPKSAITWHWARGLRLLEEASATGDVLLDVAEQLAAQPAPVHEPRRRARRAGLSDSTRDELAAVVARRFPRWSTEVCRLVAMVARLDATQVDAVAERFAAEAQRSAGTDAITETVALRIAKERWKVNRLGLNAADRAVLAQLLTDEAVTIDHPSVPFLIALGLVSTRGSRARLTAIGRRLGEQAVHL